ncbi:hypothetical protein B0H13DRAFT_2056590 [Mycena leptocephala]|nr:hypothetical protein B0H13DRAFT_2056590 [Mycena leptocephala]
MLLDRRILPRHTLCSQLNLARISAPWRRVQRLLFRSLSHLLPGSCLLNSSASLLPFLHSYLFITPAIAYSSLRLRIHSASRPNIRSVTDSTPLVSILTCASGLSTCYRLRPNTSAISGIAEPAGAWSESDQTGMSCDAEGVSNPRKWTRARKIPTLDPNFSSLRSSPATLATYAGYIVIHRGRRQSKVSS